MPLPVDRPVDQPVAQRKFDESDLMLNRWSAKYQIKEMTPFCLRFGETFGIPLEMLLERIRFLVLYNKFRFRSNLLRVSRFFSKFEMGT